MKNYTGTSSHENDANKDDATITAEVYRTAYAPGGRIILPSKSYTALAPVGAVVIAPVSTVPKIISKVGAVGNVTAAENTI